MAAPMTMPRKRSRRIVVGDVEYRFMVTGRGDRPRLTVELATGQGRPIGTCFRPDFPVTPGIVRRFIERALAVGWVPAGSGSPPGVDDFLEQMAALAEPGPVSSPLWAVAVAWADGAEHLAPYPWVGGEPREPGWVRLHPQATDAEVAALVATWCRDAEVEPGSELAGALAQLATQQLRIFGGVQWRRHSEEVASPGCCCWLDGWQEWLTRLAGSSFWGGHDPWVGLENRGASILIHPGDGRPTVEVERFHYLDLIRRMEHDLVAFAGRLERWADHHAPAMAVELARWYARGVALRQPPAHLRQSKNSS